MCACMCLCVSVSVFDAQEREEFSWKRIVDVIESFCANIPLRQSLLDWARFAFLLEIWQMFEEYVGALSSGGVNATYAIE